MGYVYRDIVYYLILYIAIRNQYIILVLETQFFFFKFNPLSLNPGGRYVNLVVVFRFNNVKTIKMTLNFNRGRKKIVPFFCQG